jgi:hypothetical protein
MASRSFGHCLNPAILLEDCANLVKNPGPVQKTGWPPSIRKLSPVHVLADREYVVITISTGGIGAAWGYLVFPDPNANISVRSYASRSLVCPGLFKYETDE